jgi:hypothetical protein
MLAVGSSGGDVCVCVCVWGGGGRGARYSRTRTQVLFQAKPRVLLEGSHRRGHNCKQMRAENMGVGTTVKTLSL